uniref:DED domain-containing protein n=1 Tax=Oryzias latipes TaxID=8090 RepID=A0A3P9H614_ORYLA
MDRWTLSRKDDELNSEEVAELCFLCTDSIPRKRLEGVRTFLKLEEVSLLDSFYLSQLLKTIHREDLVRLLQNDSRHAEETDAIPILCSDYR